MIQITNRTSNIIKYFLFTLGAGILLFQYLVNRSMWTDEAKLALNVMHHTFGELTQPLDHQQSAPIIFLWLSKLFSTIFGNSDYALRVTPLLFGLISIPLFHTVLLRFTKSNFWSLLGLVFFIGNLNLILYATEFKQYIADLFVFIALLTLVVSQNERIKPIRYYLIGIASFVFLFLSNATLIFLPVLMIYVFYTEVITSKKTIKNNYPVLFLGSSVLLGIIFFYITVVHDNPLKQSMVNFWLGTFPPKPFYSKEFLSWIINDLNYYLLNISKIIPPLYYSLVILSVIGIVLKRSWHLFFLLLAPLLVHITLSYMHLYPFYGRFITYFIPIQIIFFIVGIQQLSELLAHVPKAKSAFQVLIALVSSLILIINTANKLPLRKEEFKPAIQQISLHQKPNDLTYVYYGSVFAFKRYQEIFSIKNYVFGKGHRDQNEKYIEDISTIINTNHRVWFVFSHLYPWDGRKVEDEVIYDYLKEQGDISYDQRFTGSRVFLFEKFPQP